MKNQRLVAGLFILIAGATTGCSSATTASPSETQHDPLPALAKLRAEDFGAESVDCQRALEGDYVLVEDVGLVEGPGPCYLIPAGDDLETSLTKVEQNLLDLAGGHLVSSGCTPLARGRNYPLVRDCTGMLLLDRQPTTLVSIQILPEYSQDAMIAVTDAVAAGGTGVGVPGAAETEVQRIALLYIHLPFDTA